MEHVKQHDSKTARRVVFLVALLLLIAGLVGLLVWVAPSDKEKGSVIARTCFDAQELRDARLLGEARRAYRAIHRAYGPVDEDTTHCASASATGGTTSALTEAALQREQGAEYLRAAEGSGAATPGSPRLRARLAYMRSLGTYPYHEQTRRDLNKLIADRAPPETRQEANRRCRLGGRLRAAGLLPEAVTVYTQALRAGRHSTCTRHGLRLTRTDIAQAQRALLEARTLAAENRPDDVVRRKYVEALAIDSSLAAAYAALDDHPSIDPREGTLFGRLRLIVEDAVDWLGRAVGWLAENAQALALAAFVALVLVLLAMLALMVVTRAKFVRGGLDRRPFRWWPFRWLIGRFTRPRILIDTFAPQDQASGSEAMFDDYLRRAPILRDDPAQLGPMQTSELPQDVVKSPEVKRDPLEDAATLVAAFPQAGAVAAMFRYLNDRAPRWDARVSGQLLDPAAQGQGLRVVITARGGHPGGTYTFWASDLPGAPFSEQEETAARYALAIWAATWAHETING